jgi:hypothetical protein
MVVALGALTLANILACRRMKRLIMSLEQMQRVLAGTLREKAEKDAKD